MGCTRHGMAVLHLPGPRSACSPHPRLMPSDLLPAISSFSSSCVPQAAASHLGAVTAADVGVLVERVATATHRLVRHQLCWFRDDASYKVRSSHAWAMRSRAVF